MNNEKYVQLWPFLSVIMQCCLHTATVQTVCTYRNTTNDLWWIMARFNHSYLPSLSRHRQNTVTVVVLYKPAY